DVILRAVNLLVAEKDYKTIAELYLSAINLEPNNVQLYISLAATYGKLHNKEKAIFYAKKALEINPALPNLKQAVDDFIQIIENEDWEKIAD
ncbi:MAG: tetratricopeptide repeat protein, partial [Candidatus Pacebacteria bacterium]|nr:tetratricopeptide repeat protein [Candidatus Paceibacterota bacterium]